MTPRRRTGQVTATFAWYRVLALARKDARELLRNPGAIVPPIVMVFGSLLPAFLVIVGVPMMVGETFEESGEFAEEAARAAGMIPELAGLSGNALVQTFLFHQFSLLLLLVPIVAAMALATHAVIGEKQSKALESQYQAFLNRMRDVSRKMQKFQPSYTYHGYVWLLTGQRGDVARSR